jgi:hypothetical protein
LNVNKERIKKKKIEIGYEKKLDFEIMENFAAALLISNCFAIQKISGNKKKLRLKLMTNDVLLPLH